MPARWSSPLKPGGGFDPAALRRWIALGVAVAVVVGGAAALGARELISVSPAPPAASTAPADPPAQAADDFVRFRDAEGGISITHPAAWQRVASSDPEVRLLAEGEDSSMMVRMADIGTEVGRGNLEDAKGLTDRLVSTAGQAQLLRKPQSVDLGGLPGYLYLYTFQDSATGQPGAHAHYFLFRGQTLISIVFQTAPAQRLVELAPLFDRIGETLRVTRG